MALTPEKLDGFRRMIERVERKTIARYLYGKVAVPAPALGAVLQLGSRWWYVTPGFPQDRSAWRVSHGDEQGPSGHETSDRHGRRYESKYHAILDVLMGYPRARVTAYVLPSGEHVVVRGGRLNPRQRRARHGR